MKPLLIGLFLFGLMVFFNFYIKVDHIVLTAIVKTVFAFAITTILVKMISGFNLLKYVYKRVR